jgi:branched-chain amino acid transport system ATP-binding protein
MALNIVQNLSPRVLTIKYQLTIILTKERVFRFTEQYIGDETGMAALLTVEEVDVTYGSGVRAVRGASIEVSEGEMVALLGSNGAGKTSLLRAISGLLPFHRGQVANGSIRFAAKDLQGEPAHARAAMGIAHTFEGRRILADFSVEENLQAGGMRVAKDLLRKRIADIYTRFPILEERRAQPAGLLSGGQQQLLAIGRALVSGPRLLLIDEPNLGLAPIAIAQVANAIRAIRESGTTVLLVEQNAHLALALADRAYVMQTGETVMHGTADQLKQQDVLRQFYLGMGEAHLPLRQRPERAERVQA